MGAVNTNMRVKQIYDYYYIPDLYTSGKKHTTIIMYLISLVQARDTILKLSYYPLIIMQSSLSK